MILWFLRVTFVRCHGIIVFCLEINALEIYTGPSSKTDAWLTYKNHFQGSKTQPAFFRGVTYHDMPIAEFLKMPLENAGFHRLQRKHPFPMYDRPRGRKDIESLRFLMTTSDALGWCPSYSRGSQNTVNHSGRCHPVGRIALLILFCLKKKRWKTNKTLSLSRESVIFIVVSRTRMDLPTFFWNAYVHASRRRRRKIRIQSVPLVHLINSIFFRRFRQTKPSKGWYGGRVIMTAV
jgi:hypothetical protein